MQDMAELLAKSSSSGILGWSRQNGSYWSGLVRLTHVGFPLRLLDRGNAINLEPGHPYKEVA
jgi:hypothetical protein